MERLLKDFSGKIDKREFKNRYNDIDNDVEAIVNKASITRCQNKMVEIFSLLEEISKHKKI